MKFSKRSTALTAFVLGAVVLTSSALADVMIGSGYYNLKNAGKNTLAKLAKDTGSFTSELNVSLKVDGTVFAEASEFGRFDLINQAKESSGTSLENGKVTKHYSYSDQDKRISKNSEDDSYYVWERDPGSNRYENRVFEDPFDDEQMADAERILDALVGNLKDIVQIEEAGDKKIYTGNLSDTQIPALVNAVSSFAVKYGIMEEQTAKRMGIPYPKSDIYVMEASGKAIENADGIIESVVGSGSLFARDKDGADHIYSVELSLNLTGINSTVVAAPDLSGQTVEYSKESNSFGLDAKYIGLYKNDIVKTKNGSFVKEGERFVEITQADENKITGKYYEVYREGYEGEAPRSFEFTVDMSDSQQHYLVAKYVENGTEKEGSLRSSGMYSQNISLELDVEFMYDDDGKFTGYSSNQRSSEYDSEFARVFE